MNFNETDSRRLILNVNLKTPHHEVTMIMHDEVMKDQVV